MPATFSWGQSWGATGSPNHVDLGTMGNLMNWKANDDGTPINYTTYPIQAGSNSYEVSLRLHFTGSFNKVQNCKFWKSSGSLGAGCTLLWASGGYQTYVKGTTDSSSKAVDALAVAQPSAANVSIGGSLSGSLVGAGYTDYVITQLKTTAAASPGDTGTVTFTVDKRAPHDSDTMGADGYMLETPSILDYSLAARREVKTSQVRTISREARPARVVAPQRLHAIHLAA